MELCSLIRQYLVQLAILVDAILQQMDGMFACWGVMDIAAWNESTVIVQVTDHPFIFLSHLEVSLPQVVTVWSLESTLAPNLPRRFDWIVQSGLDEYSMDSVVTNRDYASPRIILISVPGTRCNFDSSLARLTPVVLIAAYRRLYNEM
jgi:hypothetical protein